MDSAPLTPGAPDPLPPPTLEDLRAWFAARSRPYPWTETEDPYAIWISEVMLQQTVVTAALAPYRAWMARWPDVAALAAAGEDEVLFAWEGLGYASRARNLHKAARALAAQGLNTLPDTYEALRALPGVGDYTASAVLSFAFHRPALTLDANLKRVFQRLDAEREWTPALEARWRTLWSQRVEGAASRVSNQGVMQLGQLVCRPKNPDCGACPLAAGCQARQKGLTAEIPAPRERQTVEKATTVVFWHRSGQWWLARPQTGRFSNLWLVAPADAVPPGARPLKPRVHSYTKYRDRLGPWAAPWAGAGDPSLPPGWTGRWVTEAEARTLGMVSAYRALWEEACQPTLW